jgi:carboxymethylenebutenolidase
MSQPRIRTSDITIATNGQSVPAYQCLPEGDGAFSGVVVIQEWWGLEPHIKDIAERFARQGFATVAPDLYHGVVTSEPDEARKLVMALDRPRAVKEIVGTVSYIKAQPYSNGKVGTVGYCMGGGLSIATACNTDSLSAAVVYYGSNPDADTLANASCPVLGLYGGSDDGIPMSTAVDLSEALEKSGTPYEVHVYGGAPHAFFNDTRESYRKDVAEHSWQTTLAWFEKNLS